MSGYSGHEYSQYAADFQFVMDPALPANASETGQLNSFDTHFQLQAQSSPSQQIECSDSTQYYHNRPQGEPQFRAQRDSAQYYHNRPEPPNFASSEKISQPRFQAGQNFEPSVVGHYKSGHYSTDESISQQRVLPREIIPKQDPRTISKARSELSHHQNSTCGKLRFTSRIEF